MSIFEPRTTPDSTAQALSERLADLFRTGKINDVIADDLFLDGNPPEWRFQLQGKEDFAEWLSGYAPDGGQVTVVRTVPTVNGFVTEMTSEHLEAGVVITDRKMFLCTVVDDAITDMTVYCSGDWGPELRARHVAETTLIRP